MQETEGDERPVAARNSDESAASRIRAMSSFWDDPSRCKFGPLKGRTPSAGSSRIGDEVLDLFVAEKLPAARCRGCAGRPGLVVREVKCRPADLR